MKLNVQVLELYMISETHETPVGKPAYPYVSLVKHYGVVVFCEFKETDVRHLTVCKNQLVNYQFK